MTPDPSSTVDEEEDDIYTGIFRFDELKSMQVRPCRARGLVRHATHATFFVSEHVQQDLPSMFSPACDPAPPRQFMVSPGRETGKERTPGRKRGRGAGEREPCGSEGACFFCAPSACEAGPSGCEAGGAPCPLPPAPCPWHRARAPPLLLTNNTAAALHRRG